jgi:hypothetical protein
MRGEARLDIARERLLVQRVAGAPFEDATRAVASLGAVQAQDYLGSLWAIGLRTQASTEADVERAVVERSIVRTWPMRGTLHFVPAADVRWMLKLLAPRAISAATARHRQLELDERAFARSRDLLAKALQGGRRLTRDGTYEVLRAGRVSTAGQRGIHILARLAQEGFLCFAAREGKQQTFALLEEWVPRGRMLAHEEALAEIAARYFTGHGPATLRDFTWWSGLAAAEAREGLELAKPRLARDVFAGRDHWRPAATARGRGGNSPASRLLPAFDELLVGYRDRSATLDPEHADRVHRLLSPAVLVDGRVVGTWTRAFRGDAVLVKADLFERPGPARARAVAAAAGEYARFVGRRVAMDEPAQQRVSTRARDPRARGRR